jgi:hypothetical protein
MPGEGRQLARGGDRRDRLAAPGLDAQEEGPQRARGARRGPGGLDQRGAGMRPVVLADPAVMGRPAAGLAHGRVQPAVADQPFGRGEAADVANGRQQPESDDHVHAADRHQPAYPLVLQSTPARA